MDIKRRLPAISHVKLQNFSIYRERPLVAVDVRDGAFCLAGANGLGKSSFLAAVNFGLTGILTNPTHSSFSSMKKFYQDNLEYSRKFFDGRIEELDRDVAEVTLRFTVGKTEYEITRNLFEPQALRRLSVKDERGARLNTQTDDDEQRHREYAQLLVADCRLAKFEQFVFLQHYLLTFDERRHLLFWDDQVITPMLYLAFGIESEEAQKADELTAGVNRAESQARNAQWAATSALKQIKELGAGVVDEDLLSDLVAQHQALTDQVDESADQLHQVQREAADARLSLADVSAQYQTLKHSYDIEFAERMKVHATPELYPTIAQTLQSKKCEVCGNSGEAVVQAIRQKIEASRCPLCESPVELVQRNEGSIERLREIDKQLAAVAEAVKSAQAKRDRLDKEVDKALEVHTACMATLAEFESENEKTLPAKGSNVASLIDQRRRAESERQSALERRADWRKKRDILRGQLDPLQKKLRKAYDEAEEDFVPNFRQLARQFLGLDLDIFLEPSEKTRTRFVLGLEVQGTRRRATTALSESQRFFLDIALRMALVQQMSEPGLAATIYIDTPEGSLDIAYEARAGAMFGEFVLSGKNMIMTANINASQLLRRLAKVCRADHMQLVRMTEWATLTEVQAAEESLFDEAYETIERELVG